MAEWAVAERPKHGETDNADLAVVHELPDGLLLGAIDGLGHGPEASEASHAAAAILREHAGEPLDELVQRCHQGLRKTRGVVLTLAAIDTRSHGLTWVGVGNVDAMLIRAEEDGGAESIVAMGGIVGYELPALRAATLPLERDDLLVLATDGIRTRFRETIDGTLAPRELVDRILDEHAKENDDALVLAARYRGNR